MFQDGKRLDASGARKKLNRLMQQMRLDSCIKVLTKLAAIEENEILANSLQYYKKNKFLTPKFANVVFWRMNEHKTDYSPTFFKIQLSKAKYKEVLKNMPIGRVHLFRWLAGSERCPKSPAPNREPPIQWLTHRPM